MAIVGAIKAEAVAEPYRPPSVPFNRPPDRPPRLPYNRPPDRPFSYQYDREFDRPTRGSSHFFEPVNIQSKEHRSEVSRLLMNLYTVVIL